MFKQILPGDVVYSRKFQGLCAKPYKGRAHGCPNFGHKEGCPPGLPLINNIFDFDRELFVIYSSFNVNSYASQMALRHPEWVQYPRMLHNPRYWQPIARKEHRKDLEGFLKEHPGMGVNTSPEGHGVNVTDLMSKVGIQLHWVWPPKEELVYRVSMGGYLK